MIKKLLRKLRGLAGLGVSWSMTWGAVGAGVGFVIGVVNPEVWLWTNPVLEWTVGMGLYGFVSGVGFGGVLGMVERQHALHELSLKRVAWWGVLGSAAVPLVFGFLGMFDPGTTALDVIEAMLLTSALGGISAPGTVALARKSLEPGYQPHLLPREDVPKVTDSGN